MDVSTLNTNIPQEEGTEILCRAYDSFHNYNPPIQIHFLREILGLILNENLFQFKHMERPWELEWQYLLPIFSWLKLKQRWYNRAKPSQKNGDYILTISQASPSGTVIKKTWINLLNKLTNATLPSNSRRKNERTRLLSSTQWCLKEKD